MNDFSTTTFYYPIANSTPAPQIAMVATLNQATLEAIRQVIREELAYALQYENIRQIMREELERQDQHGLDNLLTAIDAEPAPDDEIVAVLAEMTAEEWETLVQRVKARKATE